MGPACSLPFQYFYCQLALAMAPSQLCKVVLALKEHSGAGPGQASGRQAGRHDALTRSQPPRSHFLLSTASLGRGSAAVQQQAGAGVAEAPQHPTSCQGMWLLKRVRGSDRQQLQ